MRNLGDNQILHEDFHSPQTVSKNGGVLTGPMRVSGRAYFVTSSQIVYSPLSLSTEFSYTARLKPLQVTSVEVYVWHGAKTASNATCNFFCFCSAGVAWFRIGNGITTASVQSTILAGVEQEFTCTYDGTTLSVYKDGVFVQSAAGVSPLYNAQTTLRLGSDGAEAFDYTGEFLKFSVFRKSWTAEEVLDAYESNKAELLVDGDMEAAGTSAWGNINGSTITKTTPALSGGIQSLTIASTVTSNSPGASQTILVVGKKYRVTGIAASDQALLTYPRVWAGDFVWNGATGTAIQNFDVTFTATSTSFRLCGATATSGQSVRFDDVSVKELDSPRTYQEIDASQMDVFLPLRSWFTKETESEKLVDGDMEAAGVGSWIVYNNATLTKSTVSPHSGSQNLRIAYNGTTAPGAYQSIVTVGKKYRIRGWAKSDGTQLPKIVNFSTLLWTGTNSTSWQYFDFNFIAVGGTSVVLYHSGSSGYIEFDDLSVFEVLDQTENLGTAGNFLWGDGRTVTNSPVQLKPHGAFLDTVQFLNLPALTVASTKTWSLAYLIDVKDVVTVATHYNFVIGDYATNGLLVNQYGAALYVYWNSAAVSINKANFFRRGLQTVAIVSNAGIVSCYADGQLQGATTDLSAKAALSGSYSSYFGRNGLGAEANLYNAAVQFGVAWTPRQVRNLHFRMFENLNK